MQKTTPTRSMNRRTFLKGSLISGGALLGASALGGCAPAEPKGPSLAETNPEAARTQEGWLPEKRVISEADVIKTLETNLLIVGAGTGGITAAATACDEGVDFLVAEVTAEVPRARNFIGAVNSPRTQEAGIQIDTGKLLNELTRYASGKCDQSVIKTWIDESGEMIEWLDEIMGSVGFTSVLDTDITNDCGGTDYHIPPVQHMYRAGEGANPALNRNAALEEHIGKQGHSVLFEHELIALQRDEDGPVGGAYFNTPEGIVFVKASKVLLATGGYAANPAMIKALAPEVTDRVTTGDFLPTNTGAGIIAALQVGAARDITPATMIFDRGACKPGTKAGYIEGTDQFPSNIDWNIGSQPFLKVNVRGERFGNESCPYDTMVNLGALQPGGVYCSIMDSTMKEDMERFATIGCSKIIRQEFDAWFSGGEVKQRAVGPTLPEMIEAGIMIQANTIEELAQGLQIDSDNLAATVARYNELAARGVDEDFGKEAHRLSAIDTPPYYGFTMGGCMLTTLDGLRINADCQVLDIEHNPIEGLYAIGDCSGSFFADNYPEYIVGVAAGRTMTFARHVAKNA